MKEEPSPKRIVQKQNIYTHKILTSLYKDCINISCTDTYFSTGKKIRRYWQKIHLSKFMHVQSYN